MLITSKENGKIKHIKKLQYFILLIYNYFISSSLSLIDCSSVI